MRKNKDTMERIAQDLSELRSDFGQSTSKADIKEAADSNPYSQSTIVAGNGLYPHLCNHQE
jgi:hypothetical protein